MNLLVVILERQTNKNNKQIRNQPNQIDGNENATASKPFTLQPFEITSAPLEIFDQNVPQDLTERFMNGNSKRRTEIVVSTELPARVTFTQSSLRHVRINSKTLQNF